MIAYVCKYTPVELIKAFGEEVYKLEPKVASVENAERFLHTNLCSFSKAVLEYILQNDIKRVVLTACCDSMKRVYDVLKDKMEFIDIIDVPRMDLPQSVEYFSFELKRFKEKLSYFLKKEFDREIFESEVRKLTNNYKNEECEIAILGAHAREDVVKTATELSNGRVLNLTCSGPRICLQDNKFDGSIEDYAKILLSLLPCMRMNMERDFLNKNHYKGIIYNTIKFCDFYSFEYAKIKDRQNVLKIEMDYSQELSQQIVTRIEAFVEITEKPQIKSMEKQGRKKYFAGIDSGSTSTKVVIIDDSKNILSYYITKTGFDVIKSAKSALEKACELAGLKIEDIGFIVSTGYGRISIPFANLQVTEITCHAKGIHFLFPSARTIIDVGGQDSKVIKIDQNGNVVDFVMNDKCSAGTGRFIEYMARVLEVRVEEFSKWQEGKEDLTISSMCTVFAESEVISLVAQGKRREDIIRAINKAVATKIISLVNRVKAEEDFVFTGGVAKNKGIFSELEKRLGLKLFTPFEPQITGALGAALIGLEKRG
ncbi:putative CoA-substrate-specific enzyme activase [Caldicellulosiruptor bescii]|uniref:CoA-substrate-specific enzyme activase n=2 Tax=Caldicellulosiruptor bescii TaxID=31899 RepID=B9MMB9_CALBD|nr:acyl-CoA dehydratase activase [Caldicellulosiruptor bescii]ACM59351.1 CoA-substrate-specific enzyme activase [Caldicellulosiruptor bescii DSM 6725]PBC88192.1 putative CoA-substrate-specific enzyme activase [Caldicellulosiruptor bescii]PBC92327.1 putative CoA-substrate-specific enzyme activase [Caldicellulosiruptor bescii]PBD04862.1 putative CoA-substrate-specific enzyme activase [Caldicellulosiruptor bescii]PBD05508.1 putative CoA-substrate-specific enzyme activase [Caldicellulosiruptor bes